MSESSEIIARLVASGVNYESIGQAVGRNRSLIRQVNIGTKPGNNLRDALSALEARLAGRGGQDANRAARAAVVPSVPRRTTGRGSLARVRKPTTIAGRSWSASTVKKSATRTGARGLGHAIADAADAGRQLAVTVSVDGHLSVQVYGSSKRGRSGLRGSADFKLGDAADVWEEIEASGGDVTAYVAERMVEAGLVDSSEVGYVKEHLVEIELRSFDG